MRRQAAVIVAVAALGTVAQTPADALQEELVAGVCDVDLVVTRSLDSYDFEMEEGDIGECTTTDGDGTLELSGSADGTPGLTCAGGIADGVASIRFETDDHIQETDIADLMIANKAGVVTFHAFAFNAMTDVEVLGELQQSHTAVNTCVNNPVEVHWVGTVAVQAGQVP